VAWREEECEAAQLFSWCVGSGRTDRRCTASAAGVAAEDAMQQHLAMPISSCRAAAVPLSVPLSLSLSVSLWASSLSLPLTGTGRAQQWAAIWWRVFTASSS